MKKLGSWVSCQSGQIRNSRDMRTLVFIAANATVAPMNLCSEFQNYANECARIAATSRDPATKAAWQKLADRWTRVAETQSEAEHQRSEVQDSRPPRRQRTGAAVHSGPPSSRVSECLNAR